MYPRNVARALLVIANMQQYANGYFKIESNVDNIEYPTLFLMPFRSWPETNVIPDAIE
jgi:hypothetical protein